MFVLYVPMFVRVRVLTIIIIIIDVFNMNTSQINSLVRSDVVARKTFRGTFPCDKIPAPPNLPSSYVVNTDDSTKKGRHWCAIYIQHSPRKSYFFDSFGMKPNKHITKYLNKYARGYVRSQCRIQGMLSSTCAYYCIYFIQMAARGYDLAAILKRFEHDDAVSNDIVITKYVNKRFDMAYPVYDQDMLTDQIGRSFADFVPKSVDGSL
jgi:hypothetical protein